MIKRFKHWAIERYLEGIEVNGFFFIAIDNLVEEYGKDIVNLAASRSDLSGSVEENYDNILYHCIKIRGDENEQTK